MRASVSGAPGRVSPRIKCDGELPQSTTEIKTKVAVVAPRQIATPAAKEGRPRSSATHATCHERGGGLTGQRAEQRDAQHAAGFAGSSEGRRRRLPERDFSTLPSRVEVSGGTSKPRPAPMIISWPPISP